MSKPPVIWTIAGFDPSSGAGITADLKTISSFECYGVACITALTVQNTLGVRRVEPISPETVRETLQALLEDLPPNAIKVGMLASAGVASAVADFLAGLHQSGSAQSCPIVVDPILRSSSGAKLLDAAGMRVLLARLLPLATVITPNCTEAALLTGLAEGDAEAMARSLRRLGAAAAVVTGGDTGGDARGRGAEAEDADRNAEDVLAYAAAGMELVETLSAPRIASSATHGTGCAFATAIACALARGQNVATAVTSAKAFVRRSIERAPGLGHGRGPMGLEQERKG